MIGILMFELGLKVKAAHPLQSYVQHKTLGYLLVSARQELRSRCKSFDLQANRLKEIGESFAYLSIIVN
jgi:hypothetical protein